MGITSANLSVIGNQNNDVIRLPIDYLDQI